MCTYNARRTAIDHDTEEPTEAEPTNQFPSRSQAMRCQLRDHNIHLAGIQETTSKEGHSHLDGYMQFSEATEQKIGISLLISTTIPYAQRGDVKHYFKYQNVKILHKSNRRLVASIQTPLLQEIVHVWHTPHHKEPAHKRIRQQWWTDTTKLLWQWPPTVILADGNAVITSTPSEGIGTVKPEFCDATQDDDNGQRFREVAAEFNAHVINTIIPHEGGLTYTTAPKDDKRRIPKRIDYVATAKKHLHATTNVQILYDFDTGSAAGDHYPVLVQTKSSVNGTKSRGAKRPLDKQKTCDPELRQGFRQHLQMLPLHDWSVDPNVQSAQINKVVNQISDVLFQPDRFTPRQPYVSRDTMRLIRYRRYLLSVLRNDHLEKDTWCLFLKKLPEDHDQLAQPADPWLHESNLFRMAVYTYKATNNVEDLVSAAKIFYRKTTKILTKCLRQDRVNHLEAMGKNLQCELDNNDTKVAASTTRSILQYGGRKPNKHQSRLPAKAPLPEYEDDQGKVLATDHYIADHQTKHFAKLEDAVVCTAKEIQTRYNSEVNTCAMTTALTMEQIPIQMATQQLWTREARQSTKPGWYYHQLVKDCTSGTITAIPSSDMQNCAANAGTTQLQTWNRCDSLQK